MGRRNTAGKRRAPRAWPHRGRTRQRPPLAHGRSPRFTACFRSPIALPIARPPCPMVPIWKRTCVLSGTTGHQRPVLTWALRWSPRAKRRSLRHQWLYLHSLASFTELERLIGFYVKEHNTHMPHHAFDGQTPDEVYFDQVDRVRDRLTAARHHARRARMVANRRELCRVCPPPTHQSVSVIRAVANAPP